MSKPQRTSLLLLLFASLAAAVFTSSAVADRSAAHSLPILFFHGVTSSAKAGYFLQQNLSTDARPFIPLTFCENECSVRDLPTQVNLAIAQIRSIVANDSRFQNGYVFIGHSQGGVLARAVIEEMDDHKVHTFISLAGAQNGIFYGPQDSDRLPTQVFLKGLGPKMLPPSVIDFANYTQEQIVAGTPQIDFLQVLNSQPALQDKLSAANLMRSPVKSDWLRTNKFLPAINGFRSRTTSLRDCMRRKINFLKLRAAHFFASPADDVIAPWQTSLFGQYQEVTDMARLKSQYTKLKVLPMAQTHEYRQDTYGLRTLERRGALHLHTVDGVGHSCWVADSTPNGATEMCKFQPVFEKHLHPLLVAPSADVQSPHRQDYRQYN